MIEWTAAHVCFITSGSLRISTTSSASSIVRGRISNLSVLVIVSGSTTTIFSKVGIPMSHVAVCVGLCAFV